MKIKNIFLIAIVAFFSQHAISQEGLPVYTDYLTDNYYLLFPSMAGAANCSKIRMTGRQQWFGDDNAPRLLTLNANGRVGESNSGVGAIFYTDKNGYHSQTGAYVTYAHHLMFSRSELDLNMLSFGLNIGAIQYKLDETSFLNELPDRLISGIEQSSTNFNMDFGFSYFLYNFYAHGVVKNLIKNDGINNDVEITSNLRRFIFLTGIVIGKQDSEWSYEPSVMFQYRDGTKESFFDINAKVYKDMDFGMLWAGLSYRRSLDGADFIEDNGSVSSQKLQYISPLVGVNVNNFMFAYTYAYQANSVTFTNGGFHQITLGYNFSCRKERYHCNCPAVN